MALSHVMIHQAVMRHLFILCARTAVVGIRIDADASAWGKDSRDLDVLGVHQLDEILHDGVDAVFVEIAMVTEGEQVKLERFALHHAAVGQVGDANLSKVWLSCDGAEGCEFRAIEPYPIVVLWVLVLKAFQYLWRIVLSIFCFLSKGDEPFVFTLIFHEEVWGKGFVLMFVRGGVKCH